MSAQQITQLHELPAELLAAVLSPTCPNPAIGSSIPDEVWSSINWRSVAAEANGHVVGVLVYERLRELGLAERLPDEVRKAWEADSLHAMLQHAIHRQDALAMSKTFAQYGIRHAFIKGFAYRDWLYCPSWVRLGGDIDVLIDRHNVELVRHLMRRADFTQAAYSEDHQYFRPATPEEIARVESHHFELGEFTKDHLLINTPEWLLGPAFVRRSPFAFGYSADIPLLHSCFDIHWALHFLFVDATPLNYTKTVAIGDEESIPVLSTEWNILYSAFKLYFESFDRPGYGFNHLVDLTALTDGARQVDWSVVAELATRYELEGALFYTLSAARRLSGKKCVPTGLLDDWSRIKAKAITHEAPSRLDFGDFISYLINKRVGSDFPKVNN
jgi:hypothetical protein